MCFFILITLPQRLLQPCPSPVAHTEASLLLQLEGGVLSTLPLSHLHCIQPTKITPSSHRLTQWVTLPPPLPHVIFTGDSFSLDKYSKPLVRWIPAASFLIHSKDHSHECGGFCFGCLWQEACQYRASHRRQDQTVGSGTHPLHSSHSATWKIRLRAEDPQFSQFGTHHPHPTEL